MKVKTLLFDTYIGFINNSVGSGTFRNYYATVGGVKTDILENGGLSCATFVSSILCIFRLVRKMHTTVAGTVTDMEEKGWFKILKPRVGSVLVWRENEKSDGHKHIGFYVGNNQAVSNSTSVGIPVRHHFTFGAKDTKREIEAIYWNPKFDLPL